MAGNSNLTLALRIQADLKQAQTALQQLDNTLSGVSQSAQSASGSAGATGGALDRVQSSAAGAATQTNAYSSAAAHAATQSTAASKGIDQVTSSADQGNPALARMARGMATLVGSFIGLQAASRAITMVDDYGQMASRIEQVTRSTAEYEQVQARLRASADDTYRPLQEAQELYIRTAEALRSLGYETTSTLDITDSFSLLLVTNAASAQRGASAIDAYSKAIQTGRISSDEWQTILAAMPSVVNAIADATGKSAEEIRRLGVEGKLALDDLNQGLHDSLEENRAAAEAMPTTVQDAYVKLGNALQVYLGEANRSNQMTEAMAWAIAQLGENVELIANLVGVVAAAAFARYITNLGLATKASIATTLAKRAQAAEELRLAQAQHAQTTSTLAQVQALRGLGASHAQVTAATAAHEAATRRLAAAQAATRGITGLLGGPAGIAMLAASAAASFFLFRDSSDELASSLGNLREPMDGVLERLKQMSTAEQQQELTLLREQITALEETAREQLTDLQLAIQFIPANNAQHGLAIQQALAPLKQAMADAAQGIEADWEVAMNTINQSDAIPERLSRRLLDLVASQAKAAREAREMQARHDDLTASLDNNRRALADNNAELDKRSANADEYLQRLRRQTEDTLDPSALGRAHRDLRDREELQDATREQREEIEKEAAALDKATEARRRSGASVRQGASDAEREAKAIESYVLQLERHAATYGMTATQVRAYELAERGLKDSMLERAQAALSSLEASEQQREVEKDLIELEQIRIDLMKATGQAAEAAEVEIERKYGQLRDRLIESANTDGAELVEKLINVERARVRISEIEKEMDRLFSSTSRKEQTIQAQLNTGLITERTARQKIVELHRQQADELQALLPLLEYAASITDDPAALAGTLDQIERIKHELELMQYTANEFAIALRDGLQGGLEESIMGLVRGTHDLRDALASLVLGIAESMARMGSEALADMATQGVMNLFSQGVQAATQAAGQKAVAEVAAINTVTAAQTAADATRAASSVAAANTAAAGQATAAATTASSWTPAAIAASIGSFGGAAAVGLAAVVAALAFQAFADGGHVRGPGTTTSDSIPAWLSDYEFVTRAAVVQQPGALPFLQDFNARGMTALDDWAGRVRHATGGLAGVPAPALPAPSMGVGQLAEPAAPSTPNVNNNFRFNAVFDIEDVARRLGTSSAFKDILINVTASNASAMNEALS